MKTACFAFIAILFIHLATAQTTPVGFAMEQYVSQPDDEITVPVRVNDFNSIGGYQFTLTWNPEVIELLEVVNQSIPAFYGEQAITEGMLTTSWNDGTASSVSLDDNAIAFELRFKVVGENGAFTQIKIGSEITPSEAFTHTFDLVDIVPVHGSVKVEQPTSLGTHHSPLNIRLSVQPNPFSNSTNITFDIPQTEKVQIVIYDLLGKAVKTFSATCNAGEHQIEWNGENNDGTPLSKGLYHISMTAGSSSASQKVLLIK